MAIQTRLEDTVIGDKIIAEYVASSGAVGTFSKLGTSVAALIPATSSATPNGSFYWIKVAEDYKGRSILVADRNVQHSISWDKLNTAGVATQGGVAITSLGLDPAKWKTNIRLLTGGTSSTTTANSEWNQYIVNGPVGSDNATWSYSTVTSWTSTVENGQPNRRAERGYSTNAAFWQSSVSSSATRYDGFRPVLVAESLIQPIQNKYLIQDGTEIKKYANGTDGTTSIIPTMTANNLPSPYIVSASSGEASAWKAFDKDTTTWWTSADSLTDPFPKWIQADIGTAKVIQKYKITVRSIPNRAPKDFTLEGSNDGINFTVVHTVAGRTWDSSMTDVPQEFASNNVTAYRYYRINVSNTVSDPDYLQISQLDLFEHSFSSWQTVGTDPVTKAMFDTSGVIIEKIPELNRAISSFELQMDSVEATSGKMFSKSIDLSRYVDIKSVGIKTV